MEWLLEIDTSPSVPVVDGPVGKVSNNKTRG